MSETRHSVSINTFVHRAHVYTCTCPHTETFAQHAACLTLCYTCHHTEAKQAAEKERDDVKQERDLLKSTQDYYNNIRITMMRVPSPAALGAPAAAAVLSVDTSAASVATTAVAVAATTSTADAVDLNISTTEGDEGGESSGNNAHNSGAAAGGLGGVKK